MNSYSPMPYRRSKRRDRQFRFRTNQISAAGGQPATPNSRTLKTVVCGNMICSGTTCGDEAAFNCLDWSAAADPDSSSWTMAGTPNNRPSGHGAILADGYDKVRVLNAMYRFTVRFKGGNDVLQDYVIAYRFEEESAAIFTFTAGTVGIDNWKDLRQSRGWVWKRFSASNSGGSIYPTSGEIIVRIPNVQRLARYYDKTNVTANTRGDYEHVITSGADSATSAFFLKFIVMTIDGVALTAGDVQVDIDVFQKIKVWKNVSDLALEPPAQEA